MMKKELFLFVFIGLCTTLSQAQITDSTSQSGFQVFDRFGALYSSEQQASQTKSSDNLICQAGYYSLYANYTLNNPLSADQEQVLCQVFTDLSNFIIPVSNSIPQIDVSVGTGITDPTVLGSASSYYINYQNQPEILDPIPWHIINGGQDPLVDLAGYSLTAGNNFHAYVNINPNTNFHTDLTSPASSTGYYDLYRMRTRCLKTIE